MGIAGHDSATGLLLLIPQGSRQIGDDESEISFDQNGILRAWNRLIRPNGQSLLLEREPAAHAGGFVGLQDGANNH